VEEVIAQQAFGLLRVGGLLRVRRAAWGRGCYSQKLLQSEAARVGRAAGLHGWAIHPADRGGR
jgi:hypothetical protein